MPQFLNQACHDWKAHWIAAQNCSQQNTYYYFRREMRWKGQQNVRVLVTADTRYRMYINGRLIRMGPAQSQPYHTYFDEQDITPYLEIGENCIAFEVYFGGHIQNSRCGLLYELRSADDEVLLISDSQTRVCRADAWKQNTMKLSSGYAPYQECLDARRVPERWNLCGFDDTRWQAADIIGGNNGMNLPPAAGPWTSLLRRPIPDMRLSEEIPTRIREEECLFITNRNRPEDLSISLSQPGRPVRYSRLEHGTDADGHGMLCVECRMDEPYGGMYNPSVLYDFGHEVTAYLELELDGFAGQTVEIGYAERLTDDYFINMIECQFADSYTLKDGKQIFRTYNWRGYRYVRLIFKNCTRPLHLLGIRGIVTEYPFPERKGFQSADREFQAVFDICRRTVKLCCNESIVDTPWREQCQWVGDVAAVTVGGIYSLFGDTLLPAKFLSQSSGNQLQTGIITNTTNTSPTYYKSCMIDYNFWWMIAVWNHYLYTGDVSVIHSQYPTVCRLMQAADELRDVYGMLNRVPFEIFIDWERNDTRGESSGLNALYYGALGILRNMAELKQDTYMMAYADRAGALLKAHFSERFWSEENGLFADANAEGVLSDIYSEGCNMLSLYFGLASPEETDTVIDRIFVHPKIRFSEACPFLSLYSLRVLHANGRSDLALRIIREKWYGRFVAKGESSTLEEWNLNGSYRYGNFYPIYRSRSHAWSAGPAEFLIRDLNRIEILEPGCTKIAVTPMRLEEDYEVSFPTPAGDVHIRQENGVVRCTADDGITLVIR